MSFPFRKPKKEDVFYVIIVIAFFAIYFFLINFAFGATENIETIEGASIIDQLKNEITERNEEIKKLQKEITELSNSIKKTEGESKTLKNDLAKITNTIAQLDKQVKITETRIKSAELNIQRLIIEINEKEKNINFDKSSVSDMMRIINENETRSPVEVVLSNKNFSNGWTEADSLMQLQEKVTERIRDLESKKQDLIKSRDQLNKQKNDLSDLKSELLDQKNIANQNKKAKNKLLADTQNKEENYKKILADRKKKMDNLSAELFDYEARLKVAIDPKSYPKSGTRVLGWPVNNPYITQRFGKTADSGRLYASGTHSGVDFRATVGTPIKASASGTIMGTGDTDASCPDVSYGKWVLIKHPNGLATLYAHLSLIKVTNGQQVSTGDVVGYSGNTGYSEGPHLHFGVFVGNAVRISGPTEYKSKVCGTYLKMPLAPTNAYLDPNAYLPLSGSNLKFD